MITLEKLLKAGNGGKGYKIDEVPDNVIENIKKCIPALQAIENEWGKEFVFNSVYRAPELNAKVSGAKFSGHMQGLCFDIADNNNQDFAKWIMNRLDLLEKWGIWIEHPAYTKKLGYWVHIGFIKKSVRAFKPKPDSPVVSKFFNGSEQPTKKITLENKKDNEIKEENNNESNMDVKKIGKSVVDVVASVVTNPLSPIGMVLQVGKKLLGRGEEERQPLTQEQEMELEKEKQDTLQAQEATKQAELLNASKGMDLIQCILSKAKDINEIMILIGRAYKHAYYTLLITFIVSLALILTNKIVPLWFEKFVLFDDTIQHTLFVIIMSIISLMIILGTIPFAIAYPPIAKIVDAITDSLAQLCKFPGKAIGSVEYGGELVKRAVDRLTKPNIK